MLINPTPMTLEDRLALLDAEAGADRSAAQNKPGVATSGTKGDDTILGTGDDDTLRGLAGDDRLVGRRSMTN